MGVMTTVFATTAAKAQDSRPPLAIVLPFGSRLVALDGTAIDIRTEHAAPLSAAATPWDEEPTWEDAEWR